MKRFFNKWLVILSLLVTLTGVSQAGTPLDLGIVLVDVVAYPTRTVFKINYTPSSTYPYFSATCFTYWFSAPGDIYIPAGTIINADTTYEISYSPAVPVGQSVILYIMIPEGCTGIYPSPQYVGGFYPTVVVDSGPVTPTETTATTTVGESVPEECFFGVLNCYAIFDAWIIPTRDEGGFGLTVWGIDEKGNGYFGLFVDYETLKALPEKPSENTLIAESKNGKIQFFKLASGEYQVNVGPNAEGKVFEYIFSGLPATSLTVNTWIAK